MRFSRRSRQAGLSLIEVVAAIAILGAILVGIVLAKSSHTRQLALARRKQQAVRAADALIARWWREDDVPIGQQGMIEGKESLRWKTRLARKPRLAKLGARVLRVSIYRVNAERPALASADHELVSVDLVLDKPAKTSAAEKESNPEAPPSSPPQGRTR